MNTSITEHATLEELGASLPAQALAEVLAERMRAGQDEEVGAFVRRIYDEGSHPMRWLGSIELPWTQDHGLWLAFARQIIPFGGSMFGNFDRTVPLPGPELAAEFESMARQSLARPCEQDKARELGDRARRILDMFHWTWYPGMAREAVLERVEWALELHAMAGGTSGSISWSDLLESLDDDDLMRLAERGGPLYASIRRIHPERHKELPHPQRCAPWYGIVRNHPDWFDDKPIPSDPGLVALRWDLGATDERRVELVDMLLSDADHEPLEHFAPIFDRLVREAPALFVDWLGSWRAQYRFTAPMAELIWRHRYPELMPLLLPTMLRRSSLDSFVGLLNRMVAERPDYLRELPTARLAPLLGQMDPALVRSQLPLLGELLAASSSKALREAVARCVQALDAQDVLQLFERTGWLGRGERQMQLACRDILLAHADRRVAPLLRQLLGTGLDLGSESMVEGRLLALGEPSPGALAVDAGGRVELADVEARVARFKRFSSLLKAYDQPAILALFAPLSAHAARTVLHMVATADEELPPLVTQMLAHVPAENRAQLSLELVKCWVALDGEPRARWALRLVTGHVDDRLVQTLVNAVKAWGWSKKLRAIIAVEQLGALDTLYALSQVQTLSTSRKLKDLVVAATHDALEAAAQRRGLSLLELYDELTPDFGLGGDGRVLEVGPLRYRLQLQGDLSLRVVGDKGKASKTLPALKDASLRLQWDAAQAEFKTVAAGVKAIAKQQVPRLGTAFMTSQRWPAPRWRRLFLQHPLLRIVGRSLIWRMEQGASFRIAEDFSLLDAADDAVELPEDAQVLLWHPVDAAPGETEAWRTCLSDYELQPLIDQLGAGTQLPDASQWKDQALHPAGPLQIRQGALSGLLAKWNYRPGPVEDGPGIYEHKLDLAGRQLYIELHHGRYTPYMELDNRVDIVNAVVYDSSHRGEDGRWPRLLPQQWPRALQATLMAQFSAIAAKAAGGKDGD
ncbi:Uncharacterised protein [Delftia tsuruhatensis]|uniref:DUF4132 domain-containing protein n=1 Tax=Delftia tsuruhatensis TaxID=180282 RepID=UPI001E79CB7F|nr:DUF4132 domain-containing protein [Delftia tsuruhatensis]CAB5669818.1 Uncharacterised protein [Delftia tsuruhatensis]CAC9682882.1 Uncharacterised protein [Delftia tsuruhatensis]